MNIEPTLRHLPDMSPEERARLRTNAERLRDMGTTAQKASANQVLDAMARLTEVEHQTLVVRLGGLTVAQRVDEAFKAVRMTETEARLIQVLLDHPGSTSAKLSAALGWDGQAWHMHFGTMCAKRGVYLWPAPWAEKRNADFFSGILADFVDDGSLFTMKPEVTAAFATMGIRTRSA
ncbi:hypothetical protein ACQW02_27825 [Humitalea sp. 24SJ18S-53]|uniref:hypothetical protein n=1 Tax=Humitalea sp. 24SJ18S-53 TaxID=3422307 RepID=UPI003D6657FC